MANQDNVSILCNKQSRSSNTDSIIYVVNYPENNGYALIAAPTIQNDVLAVVPSGNFDQTKPINNPGLGIVLDYAEEYVRQAPPAKAPLPFRYTKRDTLIDSRINPLLNLHWGHLDPYGVLFANSNSGCLVAAFAYALTDYHNTCQPNKTILQYTYPDAQMNSEEIDWIEVGKHKKTSILTSEGFTQNICHEKDPSSIHRSLSRIFRQIGTVANVNDIKYLDRTGGNPDSIKVLKEKYLPECTLKSIKSFSHENTRCAVSHGIALMYASDIFSNNEIAHIWVCDGYIYTKVMFTEMQEPTVDNQIPTILGTSIHESQMLYFSWGEDGIDDGWFLGDLFTSGGARYQKPYMFDINYNEFKISPRPLR